MWPKLRLAYFCFRNTIRDMCAGLRELTVYVRGPQQQPTHMCPVHVNIGHTDVTVYTITKHKPGRPRDGQTDAMTVV